ncbi:MAG: hypothetical protein ACXWOH_13280, partial [Bdellovibrionota bacterium]
FARAVASWREVFGDSVTLWRADLLPDAPVVALIAQGKQDRKAEQESAGGSLPPTHDALLGNLPGLLSLFVADHSGLDQQLGNLKAAPFHAGFPQLELTSTLDRELSGSLISNDYLLRYLASLNPEDGPSYGSLLWTRAVLKARDDRPDWGDDRQNAIKFLGFDPKAEYPDALPKPQQ